jgi:hypothetical protein
MDSSGVAFGKIAGRLQDFRKISGSDAAEEFAEFLLKVGGRGIFQSGGDFPDEKIAVFPAEAVEDDFEGADAHAEGASEFRLAGGFRAGIVKEGFEGLEKPYFSTGGPVLLQFGNDVVEEGEGPLAAVEILRRGSHGLRGRGFIQWDMGDAAAAFSGGVVTVGFDDVAFQAGEEKGAEFAAFGVDSGEETGVEDFKEKFLDAVFGVLGMGDRRPGIGEEGRVVFPAEIAEGPQRLFPVCGGDARDQAPAGEGKRGGRGN